ncbi:MAG: alanine dehydrogenase [Saprospiraceae bacterium]
MNIPSSPISFSSFFTESQFETQEERLAIDEQSGSVIIGVPMENPNLESRVALVPNSIRTLVGYGHKVMVQSGAGEKSNFSDHNYSEAGAIICTTANEVFKSDIIVKISPISIQELDMMHDGKVIISPIQLPTLSQEYFLKLQQKKITALAMEYIQAEDKSFPIVQITSELSGMVAIQTAAELLQNTKQGRGVLLGGVSGVPPAKVVILGAGLVGEFATKTALNLGASVRIFDNDITKIMRLQSAIGRQLHTSSINPVYLAYQLLSADVVIGAMHSTQGRTPILVTEEMVSKMKEGAVIVDISIDQGGCIETSEITTHQDPTFVKHGIIHYCVPNIASKVSRTASVAVSNIIIPLLVKAGSCLNIEELLYSSAGTRNGCYSYKGRITNEYISRRFELKYTNLDLLLTSSL